jgi:hypothetical protein
MMYPQSVSGQQQVFAGPYDEQCMPEKFDSYKTGRIKFSFTSFGDSIEKAQ